MKFGTFVLRVAFAWALFSSSLYAATTSSAAEALKALQEGQARFLAGKPTHPHQDAARRAEIVAGQNPLATILTCADSRVPAELIFDQGLGDVFVVRVAGNVAGTDEIGTIEYGVGHLGTPLLVVMGHTSCGAVKATVEGAQVGGSIPDLLGNIAPAVAQARAANPGAGAAALLAAAVKLNVWVSVEEIFKRSAEVREAVKAGKLQVVGAVYDLATGSVEIMGAHAEQTRLLAEESSETTHEKASGAAGAKEGKAAPAPGAVEKSGQAPVAYKSTVLFWIAGAVAALALVLGGTWAFSNGGMKRWTVGRRITAGFVAVLAVLAVIAFFGYAGLHQAFEEFTEYRGDARHSNLAARIQSNFLEARIAVKDYRLTGKAEDVAQFAERRAQFLEFIATGKKTIQEPERLKLLATAEKQFEAYAAEFGELQKATAARQTQEMAAINRRMAPLGDTVDHEMEQLELAFLADQDEAGPRVNFQLQEAQRTILVVCVSALLLGVGLSGIIARSITRPLQVITGGLSDGAEQVSAAAGQVSGSAQSLAEGASEQAASLEETSASIEELTSMTRRNSDSASEAKKIAAETRAAADAGAGDMERMKGAMDAIKLSSGEIAKIVKTIDEIAFQTNILALNAAVEAARAGEAGMGFAVVAEEVRALAQRSAQAAKESAGKIEDSVSKSENGVAISAKVAESLQQIVDRARRVDALVAEIATASQEQTQGIGQVNTAVSQMDQVTQSNAGAAEESAAAAEELSAQATQLRSIVQELGLLVGTARQPAAAETKVSPQGKGRAATMGVMRVPAKAKAPISAPQRKRQAAPVSDITCHTV